MRAGTYRDPSEGLFLDRNERSAPLDEETLEALSQRLANIPLNLYPELVPFYQKSFWKTVLLKNLLFGVKDSSKVVVWVEFKDMLKNF